MSTVPAINQPGRVPRPSAVRTLNVTVLMGGPGNERQVSLQSGEAIAGALESLGHRVARADVGPRNFSALDIAADLVFIALHGEFGEDGRLQRVLDERGIRYTGSGARASAEAMDKLASKRVFDARGIPTPAYQVIERLSQQEEPAFCVRLPAVVKPISGGSSVDTHVVFHSLQLFSTVHRLLSRYGRCLVEDFVRGPELTVGILGKRVLGPLQIRTQRGFYDYQAKYLDDHTEYLFDVDLPDDVLASVREQSLRAHDVLGCRDFSRVDWVVDRVSQHPYCLEVNTIPGFTSHSLLPKMAQHSGLSFADMCGEIVELALRRE